MSHRRSQDLKAHGWRKLFPLVLGMLASVPAGLCVDHTTDFGYMLDGEVAAYKKANYSMAYTCGSFAVKIKPNDALAHYFLARSLFKLNRGREAIEQYIEAARCTKDPKVLAYIQLGLDEVTQPNRPPVKSAKSAISKTSPVAKASSTPEEKPTVVTKELSEAQQQALAEAKTEIELRRKEADRLVAKIHDEEAAQLSGVEQYQFKETDTNGKTDKVYEQTPAYTALFEKLKKDNEGRISDINERFEKEKARIEAASKVRVDAYASSASGEKTQLKMGNGLTQVMPIGSNMYVRNILNYGSDNRTPELKAKMQGLDDKMAPAPANTSKATGGK